MALKNISKGIKDPELRKKVTPDYEIGCKRILISNGYYPALDRDNVDLVTEGIARGLQDDDVGALLKLREESAGVKVRLAR